jgi:hypothetical protein
MPLLCCKAVESHSLGIVLRNTPSRIVAQSNHILPEAAARRLALPSQRKPSRFVCSNTIAPNDVPLLYAQSNAAPAEANANARFTSLATPDLP